MLTAPEYWKPYNPSDISIGINHKLLFRAKVVKMLSISHRKGRLSHGFFTLFHAPTSPVLLAFQVRPPSLCDVLFSVPRSINFRHVFLVVSPHQRLYRQTLLIFRAMPSVLLRWDRRRRRLGLLSRFAPMEQLRRAHITGFHLGRCCGNPRISHEHSCMLRATRSRDTCSGRCW